VVKTAILVEGKNDKEFFQKLIGHLGVDGNQAIYYVLNGKSNFFKTEKYEDLMLEVGSGQIDQVLFVVDADDVTNDQKNGGYENTEKELTKIIDQLGIQAISSTYIMCDPTTQTGNLESLILSATPEPHKSCIEIFISCSEFKSKDSHKAIYNQLYKLAYPDKPFDYAHPHFETLKKKLIDIFK